MIHVRHDFATDQENIMPLTRIALRRGRPPQYRQAIMDGLYAAMRETFNRRYDLCESTVVYTTTLLTARDREDTARWT